MFCKVKKNIFTIDRGDTFEFPLDIYEGSDFTCSKYYLKPGDNIYVAILQPHESFENAIIRKKLDINSDTDENGNPLFILESLDTEYLLVGKYFITAKLEQTFGSRTVISTILPMKEFFITGTNKHVDSKNIITNTTSVINNNESIWESLNGDNGSGNNDDMYVWEKI